MRSDRGFTILELLIALAMALVVVAAAFSASRAAPDYFAVQNETTDQDQRLRVGAEMLFRDLLMAESVRPYRSDGSMPDPPGTFKADTITAIGPGVKTYWLRTDEGAGTFQLMSYSGGASFDVPVVDNVVALAFAYQGDPQPPTMIRPLDDPAGPWTSYGPPPALDALGPYAARENCVFVDNGTMLPDSRLTALGAAAGPIALAPAQFSDGPWCPDDVAPNRWDADLLRIRTIVVRIRVQAALASLRGPAGDLFLHGGTARAGSRYAPDLDVEFRVSPRNLLHGA